MRQSGKALRKPIRLVAAAGSGGAENKGLAQLPRSFPYP
jgi:hypothetical protein